MNYFKFPIVLPKGIRKEENRPGSITEFARRGIIF
jgi:hypothetical protein